MAWYELGTRVYATEEGDGVPVVLIHGLTLDHRLWEPQVGPLAAHYRVIRYDLGGFGKSGEPTGPGRDRDDLKGLLNAMNVERAHLVGLSRGGRVALDFALRYPSRVHHLALLDTRIVLEERSAEDSTKDWRDQVSELMGQNPDATRRKAALKVWRTAPLWKNPAGTINPLVDVMLTTYFQSNHVWNSAPGPAMLTERALRSVQARTLVLVGADDLPEYQQSGLWLEDLIPKCTRATVDNAGHISNLDNPSAINDALVSFLRARTGG